MPQLTSSDRTSIACKQTGHGPAVVLIHVGPFTQALNAGLAGLLADQFTVYTYDRRGRGESGATYMSLDGVVQRPELWTFDYRSDDAAQVSHDQLFAAGALIMGRHTYDIFAAHWPGASDASGFADRMNTIPKYVLSRTLSKLGWTNTTALAGDDVVDRIRALKQEPGQNILQYGYGPVTRLLIDHGLLDELHVWLHPLLVGDTGPHNHIGAVGAASRWQLDDVRRLDSGLVILTYRRPDAQGCDS